MAVPESCSKSGHGGARQVSQLNSAEREEQLVGGNFLGGICVCVYKLPFFFFFFFTCAFLLHTTFYSVIFFSLFSF
jgi:hypothetical protein